MQRPVFYNLESLRGLCALGVCVFHVGWLTSLSHTTAYANVWMFVDFFFVLSGFIISYTYADRTGAAFNARNFITLRFFRLYPGARQGSCRLSHAATG